MGRLGDRPLRSRTGRPAPAHPGVEADGQTGRSEPSAPEVAEPRGRATRTLAGLLLLPLSPFIAERVPGNRHLAGSIDGDRGSFVRQALTGQVVGALLVALLATYVARRLVVHPIATPGSGPTMKEMR